MLSIASVFLIFVLLLLTGAAPFSIAYFLAPALESVCKEQEEVGMAVSALVRLSEDKVTRQKYLRRQDDIMLHNKRVRDYELMKQRAEQEKNRAEQAERASEEKDAIIAQLKAQLGEE